MALPTGASDSILVLRRNGASVDRCCGAFAPHFQKFPMDANDNGFRKTLGDKWSAYKQGRVPVDGQMIETSGFTVHPDYLNKYGTLSNGMWTKSVKYAETWLYGTVGLRPAPPQRPSLFLYPGVMSPSSRLVKQSAHLGSPATFLGPSASGYVTSEREAHGVSPARIHGDQCFGAGSKDGGKYESPVTGQETRKCGDRKPGNSRKGTAKGRSSTKDRVSAKSVCDGRLSSSTSDPYNLVRKSRLGGVDVTEPIVCGGQSRRRNASASPIRGLSREISNSPFETVKPRLPVKEVKLWKSREERLRRKSILECDVNVYELNKSRSKELEESSDEFAEVAKVTKAAKAKILRPKLNKTENRTASEGKPESDVSQIRQEKNLEVRLGGQRFKIMDESGPVLGSFFVGDQVLPTSGLPKRPPRRHKGKGVAESALWLTKSRSKSSPNLSIKSILKKSSTGDDRESTAERSPFDDEKAKKEEEGTKEKKKKEEEEEEEEEEEKKELSKSLRPLRTNASHPSQNDRFPRSLHQNAFKKKKQVQFRVNNLQESREENVNISTGVEVRESIASNETRPLDPSNDDHRSKSCEDLALLWEKNCGADLDVRENEAEQDGSPKKKALLGLHLRLKDKDPTETGSALRRSYSDRRLSPGLLGRRDVGSLRPATVAPVFNDTMALRTRSTKPDAREVFLASSVANNPSGALVIPSENPGGKRLNVSGRATGINTISYAEFSKLPDVCGYGSETPKALMKSRVPIRMKSLSPSPPPRHATIEKLVRNPDKVPVNVCPDAKANGQKDRFGTGEEPVKAGFHPKTTPDVVSGKTVVTLGSNVAIDGERVPGDVRKTCVAIHPENVEQEKRSTQGGSHRKTSVIISNFHGQDSNKVTISVRNDSSDEEPNSSTCTIIETGSNSTVIPVLSTDNKTTLIVGSSPSASPLVPTDSSGPLHDIFCTAADSNRCIFSTVDSEKFRRGLESLDPVEAIRRNLVPHICGKKDGGLTRAEEILRPREVHSSPPIAQASTAKPCPGEKEERGETGPADESRADSHAFSLTCEMQNDANVTKGRKPNDGLSSSTCVGRDGNEWSKAGPWKHELHHCSEEDISSEVTVPASSVRFYISSDAADYAEQEKDKLEYEYEIRDGFRESDKDEEVHLYEMIRDEPLYDRIKEPNGGVGSVPLHLPPSPPPSPSSLLPRAEEVVKPRGSTKSMFEGASKYDILNYLVDAKERVGEDTYLNGSPAIEVAHFRVVDSGRRLSNPVPHHRESNDGNESSRTSARNESDLFEVSKASGSIYHSDDSLTTASSSEKDMTSLKSVRKSSAEIERNDSGVGSETSHASRSRWQVSSSIRENPQHLCEDCDQVVETHITDGSVMYVPLVCRKCSKKRSERKEIIQEIVETEEKYGRDLKIILEEFYTPMLVAGLLTPDQLSSIFLNTEELLENSELLTERLRDTLEIAADQGDEDMITVNIGKLFLEAEPMLHAFESYCTRQGAAAMLLAGLEKEKELLRIFLRVSQMENAVLRRMNLNSFLMVPVQRVTKYPLLLARLYKVTPTQQEGRELLKEAQHNIELHLEHMNSEAKDVSATKVWRRFSTSAVGGRKAITESEMVNIKLRKMAVDILEWNHEEVRFILEGKLLFTQPTDNNWKRGRTIKLSSAFVLLATLGKPNSRYKVDPAEDELTFPAKTGIREATMLLVKEKCGRYTLIREPLYLDKIIVCCETEIDEFFEVQELSTKDSFIFKAEDGERTKEWYKQLQYHAQILGAWRKRRNALANIMINGMLTRACAS